MTTPQMDWLDDQRRKRAVSSDDIVTRLRTVVAVPHGVDIWTTTALEAAAEIERLRAREQDLRMHAEQDACEIERLRAAGDRLAAAVNAVACSGPRDEMAELTDAFLDWEAPRG